MKGECDLGREDFGEAAALEDLRRGAWDGADGGEDLLEAGFAVEDVGAVRERRGEGAHAVFGTFAVADFRFQGVVGVLELEGADEDALFEVHLGAAEGFGLAAYFGEILPEEDGVIADDDRGELHLEGGAVVGGDGG